MGDIGRFVIAAGYLGGGSVILAVILFVVSVIEHRRGQNVEAKWVFVLGGLAFCVGSYMAWHDADAALQEETQQFSSLNLRLDNLTKPNFNLSFGQFVDIGTYKSQTSIIFVLSVSNQGPRAQRVSRISA
jgi:hypothetical protein